MDKHQFLIELVRERETQAILCGIAGVFFIFVVVGGLIVGLTFLILALGMPLMYLAMY